MHNFNESFESSVILFILCPRTSELAAHRTRISSDAIEINQDAFTISEGAKKAEASSRTCSLAEPRIRD